MSIKNTPIQTQKLAANSFTPTLQIERSDEGNLSKQSVIALLIKHGVKETRILESPEINKEDIIPTLRKAKVKVPDSFFQDLANVVNLPFLNLIQIKNFCNKGKECAFLKVLPYRVMEQYLIIPLQIDATKASLVLSNPFNRKTMIILKLLLGNRRITWYVSTSESIIKIIETVYREIHKQHALLDLYNRNPDESAHKVLYPKQKYWLISIIIAITIGCVLSSAVTFAILFSAINIAYFLINPLKIYISIRGFQQGTNVTNISPEEINSTKDEDFPVYTVLVPVYHEAKVLRQLMKNIYNMDYPKDKLDVKILIEEEDKETIEEAQKIGLFGNPTKMVEDVTEEDYLGFLKVFDPVVIPKAEITTKPRACNYGLQRAKGKYCVIYDAEDKPDKDQLKKAAIAFSCARDEVACLQSKLNFYNANENLLSRCFSVEYSYWYDFYLEGLDKVEVPIPLGGTSNHFRIDQLRELGGWDPYNVTEDADLGVRISRRKLKTAMLECYTYEEATLKVGSWIKQRSRWFKGHLQTYLVHMRDPVKLGKELGWRKFSLFQFTFGGAVLMPLINPFLWIVTAISLFAPLFFTSLYLIPIQSICVFNLVVGNLSYLLLYVIACIKKKKYASIPLALTMPLYWILISLAAFRGLFQLITKPFYWEKTLHGMTKTVK